MSDSEDALNVCAIVPEDETEQAHCDLHDGDMKGISPVLHREGGLYVPGDEYQIYTCIECLHKSADSIPVPGTEPMMVFEIYVNNVFNTWDAGNANGPWFQFLCEGSSEDATLGEI